MAGLEWRALRARAALAIARLMDELAFDPDQLRDRRGRWVKDPRSGALPSTGGGAGAGGSSAVKRSPSPRDFGNFTPTNDALWAQRQERLGKRTPAATPADIKRGAVIPMDGGGWAKVMQDPYTTPARKRGYVQILEDGAAYARDYSVSSASEDVRRNAAERAWREAGGTREAFDRERDGALATPVTPPAEPHPVDERAELRAIQLAEIDRDVAAGRRRDATQTRIDRAEIAIRRHADAVKMHDNDPEDERWTAELREAEADLTAQGVKVESYGYTQPGRDGETARYNAMGQLDARAGREAELDARPRAIAETEATQAAREPSRNTRMDQLDERIAENERAISEPGEEYLADRRRAELKIQKKARETFGDQLPGETAAEHEARVFSKIKAAVAVVDAAEAGGWRSLVEHETDSSGMPFVTVEVLNPDTGEKFSTTWHTRKNGTYQLFGQSMVARVSVKGISDSGRRYGSTRTPTKLREIIEQNPAARQAAA